jgi:penicillin-binding protein 2
LLILLSLVCAVLVARAFAVQVVSRAYWEEEANRVMEDQTTIPTTRGRLLDFKGRELAVDLPCIDVTVDYRAIQLEPDSRWMRRLAIERLKHADPAFLQKPRAKRTEAIDAEVIIVRSQIESMWHEIANLSGKPIDEIDEQRRQIVRLVEMRKRLVWYSKYERAVKNQENRAGDSWMAWLLGQSNQELDLDKFAVTVAEELQQHVIIPNVSYAIRTQLMREIDKYPGLQLRSGVVRTYPFNDVACHVIGTLRAVDASELPDRNATANQTLTERLRNYRPTDRVGREGLEMLAEDRLAGTRGVEIRDGVGEVVRKIPPVPGQDVRTSIDIVLQASIEQTFKKVPMIPYKNAPVQMLDIPGAAVVIDIKTGQVRALVSYPTYDLNKYDELYTELANDRISNPFLNRATRYAIEPGSTVKPLVGLAAISQGIIGARDTIECTGYLILNGHRYTQFARCWTMSQFNLGHHAVPSDAPHPNGFLTYADALERSCNIYFETLGDKLGNAGLRQWFLRFGLGRETGIGLRESRGLLPAEEDLPASRQRASAWFAAIGQGQISATPIQMANVAATIARSGIWKRPTLLVDGYPKSPAFDGPDTVDLHLNREALIEVKRGMINVVNGDAGTGTAAHMSLFTVAGKTGSAQPPPLSLPRLSNSGELMRDDRGRAVFDRVALGKINAPNPLVPWYRGIGTAEDKVNSHAWMLTFAPANDPKIAVCVMIPYGGGGGLAAGSVSKRILEAAVEQGYLPAQ